MKFVVQIDKETGEIDSFIWKDKGEPPAFIKPKMKKKEKAEGEREWEEKN